MLDTIPPEFRQFVEFELTTGKYRSVEEMVAEGLWLLRERKLHELRQEIDAGIGQLDRGEGTEIADQQSLQAFFDGIRTRGGQRGD